MSKNYREIAAEACSQAWLHPDIGRPASQYVYVSYLSHRQVWAIGEPSNKTFCATWEEAVTRLTDMLHRADRYPPPDVVEAARVYKATFTLDTGSVSLIMAEWILARNAQREAECEPPF